MKIKFKNIIIIIFITVITIIIPRQAHAQTIDPSTWQSNATGLDLKTFSIMLGNRTTITEKKTAGLSFEVKDKGWPMLGLFGGMQDAGYGKVNGPVDIELGYIKTTSGITPTLSSQSADWSGNELTYNSGTPDQVKVWLSRLTSSVLAQSQASSIRLFAGNVDSYGITGTTASNKTAAPSYPKWVAYPTSSGIQIRQLSNTSTPLTGITQNWVLVWYGNNSHFIDSKTPLTYPYPEYKGCCSYENPGLPHSEAYQADGPLLLTFQNSPASIAHSLEGGVDLAFGSSAGYINILPILGREHPKAADTETWGTSSTLPANIISRINFWTQRTCDFPSRVSESYSYDPSSDKANISENITFINMCSGGTKFAPLPPVLAVAKDALASSLTFSGNVVDGNLPTEYGPTLGIENVTSYTWSFSGLKKYTEGKRVLSAGSTPSGLVQQLQTETDKIVSDGHYNPWIFNNRFHNLVVGDVYWSNPAETIYQLTEIIPALPEPQKTNLLNYLKTERTNYPPETVYKVNWTDTNGKMRGPFSVPPTANYGGTLSTRLETQRPDIIYKRVPLFNFYSLYRYYDLTNDPVPSSIVSSAKTVLDADMKEQDWASMYWFKGFPDADKRIAMLNLDRHMAGLLGVVNVSQKASDTQTEDLARVLFAKSVVLRVAMAKIPGFWYASNILKLPADPAWQPKFSAGAWYGVIFNYKWDQPSEDARQVAGLDQFGIRLYDNTGAMEPFTGLGFTWTAGGNTSPAFIYRDTVPEVGRILADFVKTETETYIKKIETSIPFWYATFADSDLGIEHDLHHPVDSYQIFMAKSWIQGESAQNLEKYIDIPWLTSGDMFYVQKLAETVKAYQGWSWNNQAGNTIPCAIASATWGGTTAVEGSSVALNVGTTGDCTGKQVNIEVRQAKTLLPDISATNQAVPNPVNIVSSSATTSWTADIWTNQCLIGSCDPVYFFKANIAGETTTVESNPRLITVTQISQPPAPTPTPTPTPTNTPTPTPTPSGTPGTGPVGYWRFDEGNGTIAQDSSGNSSTGIIRGGPLWVSGKVGSALNFKGDTLGADDYITGSSVKLNLGTSSEFTVAAWVNVALNPTQRFVQIYENGGNSLTLNDNGSGSGYRICLGAPWSLRTVCSNYGSLPLNQWHHIAGVYTGSSMIIYLDGVQLTSTAGSGSPESNSNFTIGARGVNNQNVNGIIDEVKVYKYARTQTQIIEDMNAGNPTPTPTSTPTTTPTSTPSPTPTPTSTPTPVPCTIASASWTTITILEQTPVGVTVNTSGDCKGKQVNFLVRQAKTLLPDTDAQNQPAPNPVPVIDGSTRTSWVSDPWANQCLIGICDPVYFFKANIVGDGTVFESSPRLLTVNRIVVTIPNAPTIVPLNTSATITWITVVPSTSYLEYGLENRYVGSTPEKDTSGVTDHTVVLTDLKPCTAYYFRALSKDSSGTTAPSIGGDFATTGCTADSPILSYNSTKIATSSGGTVNLLDQSSKGVTVTVPQNYNQNDAYFQIKQLSRDTFLQTITPPDPALSMVGNYLYNIGAQVDNSGTLNLTQVDPLAVFSQEISVTFSYTEQDISGFNETSLLIYRFNGTSWEALTGCLVDTTQKTITCQTTQFSDFAVFGEPASSSTPTSVPTTAPAAGGNPDGGGGSGGDSGGGSGGDSGGGSGGDSGGGGGGPAAPASGSGDLNSSGRVDIFDLSILLRSWNKGGQGDLNNTGKVDIFDLSILLRSWSR